MPQECKGQKKSYPPGNVHSEKMEFIKKGNHLSLRNPQKMLKVIP